MIIREKPNFFLYWAACSVSLLAVNSSSMFSWASPTLVKLTSNDTSINPLGRPITSSEESIIAAIPNVGCVIGTIFGGIVAERYGRKKTLIIFSLPYFFSYLLIANAQKIFFFYIARIGLGLASGCVLSVLPSYVGEISENSNRGSLGNIFGIMGCIGASLSFAIGPLVSVQVFAYILMVPVTIFFVTFIPFIPESPYHFLSKYDTFQAEKTLKKIRTDPNIEKELLYLQSVVNIEKNNKVTWKDVISSVATRRGLVVCSGLLLFQQTCGISVILVYLQPILDSGGNIIPAYIASVTIGVLQIFASIVSTFIIDRLGRKILLYASSSVCAISLFSLGIYFILNEKKYNLDSVFWLPLTSLVLYLVFFNIGYGPIPWNICGELFPTNVKSFCTSFVSCLNLIVGFLFTLFFPFLRDAFGIGGMFCVFGCLTSLSSIFLYLYVPETKGKSFQEIQLELSGKLKVKDYHLGEY